MPVFGGLSPANLRLISKYLKSAHYPQRATLVHEGELDDRLYMIQKGKIEVLKKGRNGDRRLTTLKDGDVFGEMSLIGIFPRSATVKTLRPSQILSLKGSDLHKIHEKNKDLYLMIIMNLAREVCRRLRETNEHLAEFATLSKKRRS